MRVAVALVLALVMPAAAQPAPPRGDALIDRFSLQPLRELAGELAALPLGDPLTPAQYARVVELRTRSPALARLGALDDLELGAVAEALCHTTSGPCVDATTHSLRCLADRCPVALPHPPGDAIDVVPECRPSNRPRSPAYGLGIDWGTGWQRSKYPSDSSAWSLGIEGRLRLQRYLGMVARVDRVSGRDEATDTDGNGHDDFSTGSITRISALAGPSFVLDRARYEGATRFLRLDLLGGYVATRSQSGESGPAAGIDLAYQLSIVRFGFRLVQGFGDARDATMLLAHIGLYGGSVPVDDRECRGDPPSRSTRLALGFEVPIAGYGFSDQLGYLATGLGIEAIWHLGRRVDALTHADILVYPGHDRDRVLHQAVLAGLRLDYKRRRHSAPGFFATLLGGYSQAAALTPTTVGSGPVVDLSVAWGGQDRDGAGYVRLHTRFGLGEENRDYRAVFLSAGLELRFDPDSWRDRS